MIARCVECVIWIERFFGQLGAIIEKVVVGARNCSSVRNDRIWQQTSVVGSPVLIIDICKSNVLPYYRSVTGGRSQCTQLLALIDDQPALYEIVRIEVGE